MAHPQQAEYFSAVRAVYPRHFDRARVLEVGSLDINGSVRELFTNCDYTGVDLAPGPGVDLACPGQLLDLASARFDTVISAECFEHNPFWRETLANMLRMTRPGGLVLVSCATTGRKEHGTARTNPEASPFTQGWDYYKNLAARDFERGLHLAGWLADWASWTNHVSYDLYFIGLRQGGAELKLDAALLRDLAARYAMTASAQALRRGVRTKLLGDLQSRP